MGIDTHTNGYNYDTDDATFVDDLKESQQYEFKVMQWLSSLGYDVTKRAMRIRSDVSQMARYSDDGDLEIIFRIEVKRRTDMHFTSRETFPHNTVLVDVAHAFDNARRKPYCYFILNANATHCIQVMVKDTQKHWQKMRLLDRKKNRERTFYFCPVELCTFYAIGD